MFYTVFGTTYPMSAESTLLFTSESNMHVHLFRLQEFQSCNSSIHQITRHTIYYALFIFTQAYDLALSLSENILADKSEFSSHFLYE